MSIMTGLLRRHVDISNVSGTGDVAELAEFSDGAVAVRWHGDHPSTACWNDIRDVEFIHGHKGATEIVFNDAERLVRAYQRVVPRLLMSQDRDKPLTCTPHPDHPDRLRLTFAEEWSWRKWIALLDGSSYAVSHKRVDGEVAHTFITPDGDIFLQYFTPLTSAYPDHDAHDPRD